MHRLLPATLGVGLACALLAAPAIAQQNVLILLADDVGVDNIGVYREGPSPPPTPNIDALAQNGVLFRSCWANPKCSPTRACIQTGRYSFRTGVGTAIVGTGAEVPMPPQAVLPLSEVTFAKLVRSETFLYSFGAFGKWHLSDQSNGGPFAPNLAGWPHFAGFLYAANNYYSWARCVNGVTTLCTTYSTTQIVDDALAWIRRTPEPWVCYVAFGAAHSPFHAPPPSLHTRELPPVPPHTRPLPFFKAAVEAMDTEIGRLLASLAPATRARTNVLFLSDNGTSDVVGRGPFPSGHYKGTPYEGGVRVPLIVAGPAVASPGRESGAFVGVVDLFATVVQMCGVPPAYPGVKSDSVSFLSQLSSPSVPAARDMLFAEAFEQNRVSTSGFATLRNARYKLIRRFYEEQAPRDELYDLLVDPFELSDLLTHPALMTPEQTTSYTSLGQALVTLRSS